MRNTASRTNSRSGQPDSNRLQSATNSAFVANGQPETGEHPRIELKINLPAERSRAPRYRAGCGPVSRSLAGATLIESRPGGLRLRGSGSVTPKDRKLKPNSRPKPCHIDDTEPDSENPVRTDENGQGKPRTTAASSPHTLKRHQRNRKNESGRRKMTIAS